MSRPILTSLFSKFLFRETLTSEEKGYIRSDIGAGTSDMPAPLELDAPPLDGTVRDYVTGTPSVILSGADIIVSGILTPEGANGTYTPTGIPGSLGLPGYSKSGGYNITSNFQGVSPPVSVWLITVPSGLSFPSAAAYVIFNSGVNSSNATPADAAVWSPNTSLPTTTVVGTPADYLGQSAIVSHSDGTSTEWSASSISPSAWLPRTAGIIRHANGDWYRQTLAADGTAQYELLPNQ